MNDAELGEVQTFQHPWGKEEVFADVDGRFVGKVLHVLSGQEFALEVHTEADGELSLMSGVVVIELADSHGSLKLVTMTPGQTLRVYSGAKHRISATEDSMILEVSSKA